MSTRSLCDDCGAEYHPADGHTCDPSELASAIESRVEARYEARIASLEKRIEELEEKVSNLRRFASLP